MEVKVTERENRWRLDRLLQEKLPSWISRSMIQKAIKDGRVLVNGKVKKPSYKVKTGETITIEVPKPKRIEILPEDLPVKIIYQDEYIAVVNKPPGMMAHPIPSKTSGTLVNALLHLLKDLKGIGGEIRPGIVHRLDKDTSGVMVVAKNNLAHNNLSKQFKDRVVKKTYITLARGKIDKDAFSVNVPIGRHPVIRVKMTVREDGRRSYTEFKVLRSFGKIATLLLAFPKTGRTHQIRVHLKHIGHPILGDEVYGKAGLDRIYGAERQMLHALKIGFYHPKTGEWMEFTAPIPEDFKKVIRALHELEVKS